MICVAVEVRKNIKDAVVNSNNNKGNYGYNTIVPK